MANAITLSALSAPAHAFLGSDAVAHVWTSNDDGSPQVSVVWVLVQGDEIWFGCDRSSRKARNLRREPSVVLSIEDTVWTASGFQRHLVLRGRAAILDGPDPVLMDRLAAKYTGLARHPLALRDSPTAAMVRVQIERISGIGPWVATA
ncbi:MAG: PPOX class F420-dependent oxidoreductase [Acidimicrobiia bacterium]